MPVGINFSYFNPLSSIKNSSKALKIYTLRYYIKFHSISFTYVKPNVTLGFGALFRENFYL